MVEYDKLQDYDFIFLDVFDCLLLDRYGSLSIEKKWCNHIIKYFNLSLNMIVLYDFIIKKKSSFYNNKMNDCCYRFSDLIDDIYNHFIVDKYDISLDVFKRSCIEIDVNIRKSVYIVDDEYVSLIKKLKSNGKKVYCVSDICISKEMVETVFDFYMINDLFDGIYLSSEVLFGKESGKLYEYVLKQLNVLYDKCVIINCLPYCSKFDKLGVKVVNFESNLIFPVTSKLSPKQIFKDIKGLASSPTDNFEHVIFSLYIFIERLYFDLLRKGKEEVIFLSREGEFLKKLFDVFTSKINNKKIVSKYMMVSRKSTYLPSLHSINLEKFDSLFAQYPDISVLYFLKSLNFDDSDILRVKESINRKSIDTTQFDDKISHFNDSDLFKTIISDDEFIKIYESKRILQRKNFRCYVKQISRNKNFSVVDVGWNGSIQDNIQNILGSSYDVDGYYFGLEKRNRVCDDSKKGLVFSNVPCYSHEYKLYNVNRSIYEILLGASHGSANAYILKDGKIDVELYLRKEEKYLYEHVISKIQDDMLDIFSKICDLLVNGYYDNSKCSGLFNKIHFNMMFNPNKKQIDFFNSMYHYENFGFFEFTTFEKNNKLNFLDKFKNYVIFFTKFYGYFDDVLWPMSKLCNNNMKFAAFIYRNLKRFQFFMNRIF